MNRKVLLIFIAAFTLRLLLVFSAYHGDLNNNISWGTIAVEKGLSGFYDPPSQDYCEASWPYSAPNQPPLTILMFAGLRVVWQTVENISWWLNNNFKIFPSPFIWFWEAKGMILLIKSPSILADLGIGYMIYHLIIHKFKDKRKALLISSIWLFNPIVWYNSSVWGQTDSIVNLLGLLGILGLLKKRLVWFSVFFTLSFLFKGSLGIFIPVLGMVAVWQKHSVRKWMKSVFCVLLSVFLTSIWFHPQLDLFIWLINLYKDRILPGEIGYLTANAFNFWWLVDPGKVLDSTVYFGLTARAWGIIIILLGMLGVLRWLRKCHPEFSSGSNYKKAQKQILNQVQNDKCIFLSLAIVSLLSFLFMTRIHERYLYPFFPYATLLLGMIPGMLVPYIIFSITHLLNLYHLFWAPSIPILESAFLCPVLAQIISLMNILVFIYLLRLLRKAKI